MVHWTGATDYPLSGDQVHERVTVRTAGLLRRLTARRGGRYRLDVLARCAAAI
jgi:hypothetical protein